MKSFDSLVSMMMKDDGDALYQRAQARGLNPRSNEFVPTKGWNSLGSTASPALDEHDVKVSYYKGAIIRRHGAPSSSKAATAAMVPVVQPAAGTSAAAAAILDAEVVNTFAATGVGSPTEKMPSAAVTEKGPAVAEPAIVGGLSAEGQTERGAAEEVAPADLEEVAAPAAGWAALAETSSSAAVTEAVMGETPAVVTPAEPAAGWAILAEGRARSEAAEVEVAGEAEGSAEASSSGGGGRWKSVRVGVLLTIGAGVAVGAALWARRR